MNTTTDKNQVDRNALVVNHINLAKRLAKQFYRQRPHFGFEQEDYEGAALLGLVDAAKRFDTTKCPHFRTFCYFRIRGAMFDLLRTGGGIAKRQFNRLIENQKTAMRSKNMVIEQPKTSSKSEVSAGADMLDVEKLPFTFAKTVTELASLIDTIDGVNMKLHVNVDNEPPEMSYAGAMDPEQLTALRAATSYLRNLIQQLPEQQRRLIHLRYYRGKSFDEMVEEFGGCSKSWLSRIHSSALDNLRMMILTQAEMTQQELMKPLP